MPARDRFFYSCSALVMLFVLLLAAEAQGRERSLLRERLGEEGPLRIERATLLASDSLRTFYSERDHDPVWFRYGSPARALWQLPEAIRAAADEGLEPADYHLDGLERRLLGWQRGLRSRHEQADLELLASDAFLTLAGHYAHGKVDPNAIHPNWTLARPDRSPVTLLAELDRGGFDSPRQALATALPAHADYARLRERLALYRGLASEAGFESLPAGETLRPGDRGNGVAAVVVRLGQLGDLATGHRDPGHFDAELAAAVRRFQVRHGLAADAVVGPKTRAALNLAIEARIDRLRVNLERWRWLPEELGDEYILVNIAGFFMVLVSDGVEVMRQRVVVGLPYRRTPVFSDRMTYLVLNPAWEVPPGIAAREHLPKIRRDPGYLDEMGFTLLRDWGANETIVDPASLDWEAAGNGRLRLRQRPGPENAMGRVKFMFPNRHNVYLHDTPQRGLFARSDRAASAGCIRLAKPLALAEWVLSGPRREAAMTAERIDAILARGKQTRVNLPRPVQVHLLYWTAWVERDGATHYREDIYDRDAAVLQALDASPPQAALGI